MEKQNEELASHNPRATFSDSIQYPFSRTTNSQSKILDVLIMCSREKQDMDFCARLQQGLYPLCRAYAINLWDESMILPGADHQQEMNTHVEKATLILLLLSPDFIASETYYALQQKALRKQSHKQATVIPIILRPCAWKETFETTQVLPTNGVPIASEPNSDQAILDVVEGISCVLSQLVPSFVNPFSSAHTGAIGRRNVLPALWTIPYQRNPFFTGREETLSRLHELLTTQKRVSLTQALTGLGGIGKTQTAVEYAYQYQHEYTALLWVNATSREALIAAFTTLANTLGLPTQQMRDQQHLISAVKQWFNTQTNWLLIFDDVEDVEVLSDFLPHGSGGHILLTTRAKSVGGVASTLEVEKMQVAEGTLFLLRRAKRIGVAASIATATESEQKYASELSTLMDGLPLALDQAGAYIEETGCGLARYLELYTQRRADLLKRRGKNATGHAESVATTFSLCFEKVSQVNMACTDLLRCCAFLHPDTIPEEIFTEGGPELGPVLQSLATDPLRFDDTVAELFRYSLIRRNAETQMLSIHRLVQAVLLDEMDEHLQQLWAERVVNMISKRFPGRQPRTRHHLQRYLPHVQVCATLIKRWNVPSLDVVHWLFDVGTYIESSGFFMLAEQLYVQGTTYIKNDITSMAETLFGAQGVDHIAHSSAMETITSMSPLPYLYYQQGKYEQAESQLQHAIAFIEHTFGAEHLKLIEPLGLLGTLYATTGHYAQAEVLLQRALNIHLRTSTTDMHRLAGILNTLAEVYRKQAKFVQAEPLYLQALQMLETRFGSNCIEIAYLLHNLALLYRAQEKYEQAEILYQRALSIYEQTYGPESPYVATTLNSLGALYAYQDKRAEAEPLLLKALTIREKVLGLEHPDVGRTLNSLGNIYTQQGKYAQASQTLQRSLQIYTQSFGAEHVETAMVLANLGHLYTQQSKYEQAETSLEKALTIYEKTIGLQNPEVQVIFQALMVVYISQKNYGHIQMLCQRILPALKERLGIHHKDVQDIQTMLHALSHKMQGQTSTKQALHVRASSRHTKKRKK